MKHSQDSTGPAFTADEAHALLSGKPTTNPALAEVAPVLKALRASAASAIPDAQVEHMARALAHEAVVATPVRTLARDRALALRRNSRMKARARIAAAIGAALALAFGTAGVAAAADQALPGDSLYDLKLTLEDLGLTEGGFDKRLDEVEQMAENGDESGALDHLANSIEGELADCIPGDDGSTPDPSPSPVVSPSPAPEATDDGTDSTTDEPSDDEAAEACRNAADSLRHAAESVLMNGNENSLAVRTRVAEMLRWMAGTDATGREFGQGVAERARGIDQTPEDGEDATSSETDKPGRPENAGPPENPGNSSDGGRPEGSGKPEGVGRPENPGSNKGGGRP